ncbi:MAG: DsbA family protein, partial [Gammaproteobacteria bacterium]
ELDRFELHLQWYPLAGWDGRSPPERAKVKVPLTRQDVARWCRRLHIPFKPPPINTDPTAAALLSIAAEAQGCLPAYVKKVMWSEWAEGQDIGLPEVLEEIGAAVGISGEEVRAAVASETNAKRLEDNWAHAQSLGVIGVPSFVIGEEIFWGNDRFDFVLEHLRELNN